MTKCKLGFAASGADCKFCNKPLIAGKQCRPSWPRVVFLLFLCAFAGVVTMRLQHAKHVWVVSLLFPRRLLFTGPRLRVWRLFARGCVCLLASSNHCARGRRPPRAPRSRIALGWQWVHNGTAVGSQWDRSGITVRSQWDHSGITEVR